MERPKLISPCKIEWVERGGGKGYAVNPFIGCSNGCYKGHCWAYLMAKRRGTVRDWNEWRIPKIAPKFQGLPISSEIQKEVLRLPPNSTILLSATSDIFQPSYFGYDGIVDSIMQGYWRADTADKAQLLLLTKSGTGIMRFMSWLKLVNCTVGVTVTSLERTEWEPLADSPELRLRALKDAKSAGLSTFVSIEPWIPDVTDPVAIIEASKEFVDLYMIGSFNYAGVNGDFYQQSMPEVVECRIRSGVPVYFKKELLRKVGW